MRQPLTVTVMLGGPSLEREVSLRTGAAVARALRDLGHRVHELDPRSDVWTLPPDTDVVFLALHGTYGEDGAVQRKLESMGVPYTGCGPEASALAFDKIATKRKCLAANVPTPKFEVLTAQNPSFPPGWKLPVVLKPARQGSSVGLQFVNSMEQWPAAIAEALRYDSDVLMEEKIEGRETTVGILDRQVLPIVEVRPRSGAYDYHSKYTSGATEYLCPAPFSEQATRKIQQAAWQVFQAVGGRDYARVDVMVGGAEEPYVLEVNTLPGMTETSLLPKAAAAAGLAYNELCQRMIELALKRSPRAAARTA